MRGEATETVLQTGYFGGEIDRFQNKGVLVVQGESGGINEITTAHRKDLARGQVVIDDLRSNSL